MYYNFESSVAVRRSFMTTIVHHAKNFPSISTLRYLMKTFERAGVLNILGRVKNWTLKKRR